MIGTRIHTIVVALAAVLLSSFASSSTESYDAAADEFTVRLMTFNIRFGTADDGENSWPYRSRQVIDVLKGNGSERRPGWDVVGMQEALSFQIGQIKAAIPGYAVVGVGRDDGAQAGEFSPILYRKDRFVLEESGTFWLSDTPEKPGSKHWGNQISRICTWARFADLREGGVLLVMNTHFDHVSQPSRERSAALIVERMAKLRRGADAVVLMGDFNADEDNAAVRYLKGEQELTFEDGTEAPASPKLVDSWRVVNPDSEETATFSRFRTDVTEGGKIDHVFVEPGAKVLEAEIDRQGTRGRAPSDHYPVTAVVRFPISE